MKTLDKYKIQNEFQEYQFDGKFDSGNEMKSEFYQYQMKELQIKLEETLTDYQKLLIKHNSSLKSHRYVKFNEKGSCFYIIEPGIKCECKYNISRKKFGIAGLSKDVNQDTIDDRLRSHRTIWPQLKVNYILFMKDVDIIEKSIKRIYEKEINPNGHEIIEGVTTEQLIKSVNIIIIALGIKDHHIVGEEKLKEYNDYVKTTIK